MKASLKLALGGLVLGAFLVLPSAAQTTDLIAGQHILVGTFDISVQGADGIFRYQITEPGWCIGKVHLYLGITPPLKSAPGRFPVHGDGDCSETVTLQVPLGDLASSGFFFAAHAEVRQVGGAGGGRETAWANNPFPLSHGWGSYGVFIRE